MGWVAMGLGWGLGWLQSPAESRLRGFEPTASDRKRAVVQPAAVDLAMSWLMVSLPLVI